MKPHLLLVLAIALAQPAAAQTQPPSCKDDPNHRQLDFWLGEWRVSGKNGQHVGDSRIESILEGCVVLENWTGVRGMSGKSFNVYRPQHQRWEQYWVSSTRWFEHFQGEVSEGKVVYVADQSLGPDGKLRKRRMTIRRVTPDQVQQTGENSTDGGKSWQVEYDLTYDRVPAGRIHPAGAEAKPEDVGSVDAILAALYEVISGPAGQERDWQRFRSLFAPHARLIPTGRRPDGSSGFNSLSVEGYIERTAPFFQKNGFFEREIARQTHRFGNVAQVFSTYAGRRAPDDPQPFARGINSIQLYHDGRRWWVVNILWDSESAAKPIPKEFLP